jgi:hypothetical protein
MEQIKERKDKHPSRLSSCEDCVISIELLAVEALISPRRISFIKTFNYHLIYNLISNFQVIHTSHITQLPCINPTMASPSPTYLIVGATGT